LAQAIWAQAVFGASHLSATCADVQEAGALWFQPTPVCAMSLLRVLACTLLALPAAAQCDVSAPPSTVTVKPPPGGFSGLVVSGPIEVKVAQGDGSTPVSMTGPANLVNRLGEYVSPTGALILSLLPEACKRRVLVQMTVPGPLPYIAASAGAVVTADASAGSLSASSGSRVEVGELQQASSVSFTASSGGAIYVHKGNVYFLSATASDRSRMELDGLRAGNAVITASALSSISGLETETATIVVSSTSSVKMTATKTSSYTCSSGSEITLLGNSKVREWWKGNCHVVVNPAPALAAPAPATPVQAARTPAAAVPPAAAPAAAAPAAAAPAGIILP